MAEPAWFPIVSLLSPLARWGWRLLRERVGFADTPVLTVDLANPADQAREPWLEWLHLAVQNTGLPRAAQTRCARDARGLVQVGGRLRQYALMWSNAGPDGRPAQEADIPRNFEQRVPLVLRSKFEATIFRTRVAPGVCYLTDVTFLTQGLAECELRPGEHVLAVTIQHDDAVVVPTVRFRLVVPPPDLPLRLTRQSMPG